MPKTHIIRRNSIQKNINKSIRVSISELHLHLNPKTNKLVYKGTITYFREGEGILIKSFEKYSLIRFTKKNLSAARNLLVQIFNR